MPLPQLRERRLFELDREVDPDRGLRDTLKRADPWLRSVIERTARVRG
jgi:hypothetical protein